MLFICVYICGNKTKTQSHDKENHKSNNQKFH